MTIAGISSNVDALLTNMDSFVTVLAAPPSKDEKFAGYPAASHYFLQAESDYATVSQNRRRYEYVVELYLVTNNDTPTSTELGEIYTLVEDTVQMFEESIDLSDSGLSLSPACDMLKVTPASLERITTPDGPGLMISIHLYCEADVSFR